jgi:rhomboid family GlyGly-CTERM serine protease
MMVRIPQLVACQNCRAIQDKWLFCLAVSVAALMAACWPGGLAHLRYDRFGLMDGEMWRVLTAHLVHLNLPHLFLNLFGLFLICELLWGELPLRHGIGLLAFSGMAISACLWWLHPELAWYAGLSGVLHGLWAGCVFYGLLHTANTSPRSRLPYLIGAFLLMSKLLVEFYDGPSEYTEKLIGGGVLTASHLYGALAGAVYVSALGCVRICSPSRGALQQK